MTLATEMQVGEKHVVCDYCLNVAYDNGFEGYDQQAAIMVEMGADVEDHLCDRNEEPDEDIRCDCSCPKNN